MNDKGLQVVFYLLTITFLFDLYGVYRISQQQENFIGYNVQLLLEGICLYIFFYQVFKNLKLQKIVASTGVFYVLYWIYKFVRAGGDELTLNTCETVRNISVFALAIYYYYDQVIKINATSVFNRPTFWVVTAYLIWIAGTFFLNLYFPTLSRPDQEKSYMLNYPFTVIRTVLLSVAMFMKTDDLEPPSTSQKVGSSVSKRSFQ